VLSSLPPSQLPLSLPFLGHHHRFASSHPTHSFDLSSWVVVVADPLPDNVTLLSRFLPSR
jgi:hypothetical protein